MAIAINTSQNVLLEYEPASIGERILANLVDYLVFITWFALAWGIPASIGLMNTSNVLWLFYYFATGIPVLFYDFLCEWLLNGQSLGKIALKIRVVKLDGSQPSVGEYLLRWLFRVIEGIIFFYGLVAIITVAVTGTGQRLGDKAAGTTVIRLKPKVQLSDILYTQLPENYRVTFPEAIQLSDHDIQVVREVLRRGNTDAVLRTADKLKEVLSLTSGLESYAFLQTVLNDYQYLAMQD